MFRHHLFRHHLGSAGATAIVGRRGSGGLPGASASVHMYLGRAGRARERAQKAADEAERAFHQRMERSWANLAATSALIEGVDLFFHARQHDRLPPLSQCPDCSKLMTLRMMKADRGWLEFDFECGACGRREQRSTAADVTAMSRAASMASPPRSSAARS